MAKCPDAVTSIPAELRGSNDLCDHLMGDKVNGTTTETLAREVSGRAGSHIIGTGHTSNTTPGLYLVRRHHAAADRPFSRSKSPATSGHTATRRVSAT